MTERLLTLFGLVAIIELVGGAVIRELDAPAGVLRVLHPAEMLLLISFAWSRFHLRDRVPRLILAGLLLSFAGDLVIAFGLSPLLAMPPSAAAHLAYTVAFVVLIQNHGWERDMPPRWLYGLAPWPVLALGLWLLVIDRSLPMVWLAASLAYAFVATLMTLVALQLGRRLRRHAWLPALGGVSFLVSDCIFGFFLQEGAQRPETASQVIWITYFLAQCLIAHTAALPRRFERPV